LQRLQKKRAITRLFRTRTGLLLTFAAAFASCKPAGETADPVARAEPQPVLMCGDRGRLQAQLYGAISAQLLWNRDELECGGMPRPEGRGARLHFAGQVDAENHRITLIIAIPELQRAGTGTEYPSNVTVIEEGSGRFFSTSGLDNCLTDITALNAVDETGDRFSIDGNLYCVSPLAEINGTSSMSISDMQFSGLLDWSAS